MKHTLALVATLVGTLVFCCGAAAAPATAEEYEAYDQGWSWGLGRLSYQYEYAWLTQTALGRSSLSTVHLEYRFPSTPLSLETEVINLSGRWQDGQDGAFHWEGRGTWPPVTLWWAQPLKVLPLVQVGPYGQVLEEGWQSEVGVKARLSAKLAELGGYRPFLSLHLGLASDGRVVGGAAIELGGLVVGIGALIATLASTSAPAP